MSTGEELYSRAVQTSDLALTNTSIDIDALIAAGWLRNGLACMLWRLRVEYDTVGKRAAEHAADDLTARVLALASMRTLGPTKQALAGFAVAQLTLKQKELRRMGHTLEAGDALDIVPIMLDVLLEPFCYRCTGRGTVNAYGAPQIICPSCNGVRMRKVKKPDTEGKRWLLEYLLAELERKQDEVQKAVKRFTRP